jgi:hypothetical protein
MRDRKLAPAGEHVKLVGMPCPSCPAFAQTDGGKLRFVCPRCGTSVYAPTVMGDMPKGLLIGVIIAATMFTSAGEPEPTPSVNLLAAMKLLEVA